MAARLDGAAFVAQFRELTGEGLDRELIADRLGMSRDAVDMAVRRARDRGDDLTPQRIGDHDVQEALATLTERDDLACRAEDPELFFPAGDPRSRAFAGQVADAKQVCAGCPARAECLAWALQAGVVGVWGGTDDVDRREMRTARVA